MKAIRLIILMLSGFVSLTASARFDVLFETFTERGGVKGNTVVVSMDFDPALVGHDIEVKGFFWNTVTKKRYYSSETKKIRLTSAKVENLRFFVPEASMPEAEYKAGAESFDVTGGTPRLVETYIIPNSYYFYIARDYARRHPSIDWGTLPEVAQDNTLGGVVVRMGPSKGGFPEGTISHLSGNANYITPNKPVYLDGVKLNRGLTMIYVDMKGNSASTRHSRVVYYNPEQPGPAPAPAPVKKAGPPTLTWLSMPSATGPRQSVVKVGVKSPSAITSAGLYFNGTKVRGVTPVANDGYDMVLSQQVTLADGVNVIKVEVMNSGGTVTEERSVIVGSQPIVNPNKKTVPAKDIADNSLRRLAMVVGNSQYPGQPLANTVNDASAMHGKLRALGFDVMYVTEADRRTLDKKIGEFASKASGYDVALFYYAGHGIQSKGANYLIPVDAEMSSEGDVEYECTNVNRVLDKLDESGCKMKIIALDACRNNPFERSWHRSAGRGRGLSVLNAPEGTIISYATSPGTTASDGETAHSPYTEAFLSVLDEHDLPVETVFKRIGAKVIQITNKAQTPWYSSSLFEGEFIFNPSK